MPFPTEKKDPESRKKWIQLIGRVKSANSVALWSPGKQTRVCSIHFVNSKPTKDNPYPTLKMGYDDEKRIEQITGKTKRRRLTYKENVSFHSTYLTNSTNENPITTNLPNNPTNLPDNNNNNNNNASLPNNNFTNLPNNNITNLPTIFTNPIDGVLPNVNLTSHHSVYQFVTNLANIFFIISMFSYNMCNLEYVTGIFQRNIRYIKIVYAYIKYALKIKMKD